ncbi:hypothetical protein [Profundibacter amoris]|uniref:Uncharacterized protein n=1 Tax=Profundibacter amoris TaxID=2171755 RepID=A0A347UGA6_9RHOB|nr:hypothetical protein [Profundibacter amoris]AXX97884.1 hypothetical protein BAR1_08040 [Profundibacter amoris]
MENTMITAIPAKSHKTLISILAFAVGMAISSPLPVYAGQDDEIDLVPLVPTISDISGFWNYETSFPAESGPCPSGYAMSGEILVVTNPSGTTPPGFEESAGQYVKVTILSGSVCRPESICHMAGYMNDNMTDSGVLGKVITVGSFAVVDDEHGEVANAWTLYFNSATDGVGLGSARYDHPDGSCEWAYDILLERSD